MIFDEFCDLEMPVFIIKTAVFGHFGRFFGDFWSKNGRFHYKYCLFLNFGAPEWDPEIENQDFSKIIKKFIFFKKANGGSS